MRAVLSHARAECYVCVRLFEIVVFGDCGELLLDSFFSTLKLDSNFLV